MVALVTGGGRGIGRGIALRLAAEGWQVAMTARSAGELAETVELSGGRAMAVAGDIADPVFVRGMVREVEDRLGPVALLVNNAGITGPLAPFRDNDPAEWWRCQEVNVRGPMLTCGEIVPGMITRRAGRIVNMVSGAGGRAIPDMSAYVVSKTALIRLSEQLAVELEPHGVTVFPIRPGIVRTAMVEEGRVRIPLIQSQLDQGLDVTPDVVATLVMELASGKADSLSGRLFSVGEDVGEIVRRAEEVRRGELYLLRARTL